MIKRSTKWESNKTLIIDAMLLSAAILPAVLSAAISGFTGEGHWFQRSGALMVLFSVILEFRQLGFIDAARENATVIVPIGGSGVVTTDIPERRRRLQNAAVAFIIIGTFIWGYGDLLFT